MIEIIATKFYNTIEKILKNMLKYIIYATVAQLVEQQIRNL